MEYRGPVVWRNGRIDMVRFPGGNATVGDSVVFHYYTQDYLGNNRAVINGTTGEVEQTVAYYPYGGIIPDLSSGLSTQDYKFGGKELITANGLNEYDFGARQYYQAVPHFTRIDPLCEKYYWLSPYLYCANNPVNSTDPTGMYVVDESRKEWNRNKDEILKRQRKLQSKVDNIRKKGQKKGWSEEKITEKIGDKQERADKLGSTLDAMSTIEKSKQGYALNDNKSVGKASTYLSKTDIVTISYNKTELPLFCHEVTHAGQFETGDIAFSKVSEESFLVDTYDEASAFQAQYAFEPESLKGLNPNVSLNMIHDITPSYVTGIKKGDGYPYAVNGEFQTGAVNVRIDSPIDRLLLAYPNNTAYINFVNNNRYITELYNIYYKK